MIHHPDHYELKKFSEMHNSPFSMEQQLHSWNKAIFSIGKKYFNILMKIQKGEFQEIYTFGITVLHIPKSRSKNNICQYICIAILGGFQRAIY